MAIEIGNQELIDTWASGGTIVEPDLTKKNQGWTLGEKPFFESMNFLQNQFGQKINYVMRSGVPAHSTVTAYIAGDVVTRGGFIWQALSSNSNSVPSDGNANWSKLINASELAAQLATAAPPGMIETFAGSTVPHGWLAASGQAVSRTTYAALFAAIGTTFGAGNGTTTFNLPDMRGEFPRGWDNGRGVDVGRVFGSFQADELKSHSHNVPSDIGNNVEPSTRLNSTTNNSPTQNIATASTGGTETRPRNIALLYCIKI